MCIAMVLRVAPVLAVGLLSACSRPSTPSQSSVPDAVSSGVVLAASAQSLGAIPAVDAAVAPELTLSGVLLGRECSTPGAVALEKKALAPRGDWLPLSSKSQRIRVRVPAGVFTPSEAHDGWRLVSSLKAAGLGPDATDRHFAIRLRRLSRSVDDLLADTSKNAPLAGLFLDEAFPGRTSSGFVSRPDDTMGSGSSALTSLGARPAYVWVSGVEGYNSDYVLVDLGAADTLLVVADYNSNIMGQPECYQRTIIAGVVESVVASTE
jgi:hypothetical protein